MRLLDETTLERLDTYKLQPTESPCSILSLPSSSTLVIGTAYVLPDEPKPLPNCMPMSRTSLLMIGTCAPTSPSRFLAGCSSLM